MGSGHTGECIGQGSSKSHESDSGDRCLETNCATENSGDLTNKHGDDTDEGQSNQESWESLSGGGWRNGSKGNFPSDAGEMEKGLSNCNFLHDEVIRVNLWS